MLDFVLINGDEAVFKPDFPPAKVTVVGTGTISGSGKATFGADGAIICIEGDEKSIAVSNCPYTTPAYPDVPGMGTLKVDQLAPNQKGKIKIKKGTEQKAVLLKGGDFFAKFEVQSPAKAIIKATGSVLEDNTKTYYGGNGSFINTNTKLKSALST